MNKARSIFLVFILLSGSACRVLSGKNSLLINEKSAFRCGIFFDPHFENEKVEQVYPDLGLVLANADNIGLDDTTFDRLEGHAKNCYAICNFQKRIIYEKVNEAKRLSINKKSLQQVVPLLQEVDNMKLKWLKGHQERYTTGLKELNIFQLKDWLFLEQFVKPFPSNL